MLVIGSPLEMKGDLSLRSSNKQGMEPHIHCPWGVHGAMSGDVTCSRPVRRFHAAS